MDEEKPKATTFENPHLDGRELDVFSSEYEPPTEYKVHWRTFAAVFAVAMGNVCAALSNTVNTTIRSQVASLGDPGNASWIANSNFLVTLAFGPVFGSLSDRFGKKWFIVLSALAGVVGGVVAGSAKTTLTIIGGQVLIGLGNAGCIIGVPTALEITPNKYRPWTQGFINTMASIAVIAGTLAAGAFVKFYDQGWRWSYYLEACVYGATCLLVLAFYHPPPTGLRRQEKSIGKLLAQVDYIGIFVFAGALASLIIGLTWGGSTYAWNSKQVLATLIVGGVGLLAFGVYEAFGTTVGIFDHRLFVSRNFPILLFVCAIDGMLLLGVNVLLSQQVAIVFTQDSVKIAADLMPFLVTSCFGCLPAGYLMGKTQRYRLLLISALVWCALFIGLLALLNPDRISWLYAFTAMAGIATAVTTVIPIAALSLSVPSFLLGTAGTISVSARAFGGIIGITIFTAIYDNKMAQALPADEAAVLGQAGLNVPQLLPQVLGALSAPNPPAALAQIPGLSPQLIPQILGAFLDANTYSWKFVWIAIAVVVAVNALVSCFLKPVKDRMNGHIESALEHTDVREKQIMAAVR